MMVKYGSIKKRSLAVDSVRLFFVCLQYNLKSNSYGRYSF